MINKTVTPKITTSTIKVCGEERGTASAHEEGDRGSLPHGNAPAEPTCHVASTASGAGNPRNSLIIITVFQGLLRVSRFSKSHELGRFGSGRVRSGGVRNRAGWVGLGQDALKM